MQKMDGWKLCQILTGLLVLFSPVIDQTWEAGRDEDQSIGIEDGYVEMVPRLQIEVLRWQYPDYTLFRFEKCAFFNYK